MLSMALKIMFFIAILVPQILILVAGQCVDKTVSTSLRQLKDDTNQTVTDFEIITPDGITNVTDQEDFETITRGLRDTAAEQGAISKPFYESFRAVTWFGFVPIFVLLGLVGNILGLWFLNVKQLQQPFYQLLFGLMAVDLLYLIIVLVTDSLMIMEQYNKALADYIKCYAHRNLQLIQSLTYSTCSHVIMMMSFERLMSLMLPMKLKCFVNRKYKFLIIIIILILNGVLLIPGFMTLKPKEIIDPNTNKIICIPVPTQWAKETVSFNQTYAAVVLTVARFVPGVATLSANILIAIFMARRSLHRTSLFGKERAKSDYYEQVKITMTLIILSIALLMSLVPSALATIWIKYYPNQYGKEGIEHYTYLVMVDFSYLLRVMSAANDFFIYIFTSKASRQSFAHVLKLKCCFCSEDNGNVDVRSGTKSTSESQE